VLGVLQEVLDGVRKMQQQIVIILPIRQLVKVLQVVHGQEANTVKIEVVGASQMRAHV
jgi:hypothetical protein